MKRATMTTIALLDNEAEEVAQIFESLLGGVRPSCYVKSRPDGDFMIFEFAEPSERLYRLLDELDKKISPDNQYVGRCTLARRRSASKDLLSMPETKLFQRELAESLTVDQNTFGKDFMLRYTPSVSNMEHAIVAKANNVVYGRRGSGKSSLLAYAYHSLSAQQLPVCWISMQTYNGRSDIHAAIAVIAEMLRGATSVIQNLEISGNLIARLDDLSTSDAPSVENAFERLIPQIRLILSKVATKSRPMTFFLDDIHVIDKQLQPKLLGYAYSLCRANNCYIKISGIEQWTRLWDSKSRIGIEAPHDATILELDYNLTMPDRSMAHIRSILNAHAVYCGFPNVKYLSSEDVLERLVLVSAAVPRDALSLFSQAISKASIKNQRRVSVTSVNEAASEAAEEKLKDIEKDAYSDQDKIQMALQAVKDFCILQNKKNAFLVRINNRSLEYGYIKKLIALRLIHVLHEGITPHKAGERYIALMLDYGFYVGLRAARSVALFPDRPKQLTARDLRKLPIYAKS